MEAGTSQELVVDRDVLIDASRETVFEFFTDPEKAVRWMGASATLDPRPGGVYRVHINQFTAAGEFVEVDPPARIAWTWGWEGDSMLGEPGSSLVEITLTEEDGKTRVRLVHTGLASADEVRKHRHGWAHYLDRLSVAGAGGDPGPDPGLQPE